MDCIFCKIINGEIPCKKIYEDDKVIAFMDIDPAVDGHTLVVPKKHYTDFNDLDDEIILHMNNVKKELTKYLLKKLNINAMSFTMNYGDSQVVKHVHLHLLPNYLIKTKSEKTIDEIFDIIKPE